MIGGQAVFVRIGACALFAFLMPASAFAQTIPDASAAARESERVQQEQEQRRQQQIARDRQSATGPTRLQGPDVSSPPSPAVGAPCRDIRVVSIDGVTLLPRNVSEGISTRYQGRCLGVADVERILAEVTKAYIDRGYVASRAYLPAQGLGSGTLKIVVIEGKLSGIDVQGKPGSINTATAFPFMLGQPINLRAIEQGLDQINRLASNAATIDMAPGTAEGDTVLIVHNTPTRRVHGLVAFDNFGSRATGRLQGAITGSFDDLLGLNDFVSVTRRQSSPFNRDEVGKSSSETYFASLPFGPLTISVGWSDSQYRTSTATASGKALILTGESHNRFVTADVAAKRWRDGQFGFSATLTTRDNRNFLDGELLFVTSRKLTIADLDASVQTTRFGGFATLGAGASFGLKAFGAQQDLPGLTADEPRAQFAKYRLNASYFNGTTIAGQRIELTSAMAAQYSSQALFGSEQFSIGGAYTVRGFRESTLADDNGFYLRNDVAAPIKVGNWMGSPVVVRPYIGADIGYVEGRVANGFGGTLIGGTIGSTITIGRAFMDFFATKRFAAPARLTNEGVMVFGRMSVRI